MSLVVARITNGSSRLIADMRTGHEGQTKPARFSDAVLKLFILQPNLCIGFAGEVTAAIEAIRRVAMLGEPRAADRVVHVLSGEARKGRADFIVAEPKRLVRIKGAEAATCTACWIGAYDAFERYQGRFLARDSYSGDYPELREATRMSEAFGEVIDDSAITSVGEAMTMVLMGQKGFLYAPSGRVSMPGGQEIPSGVPTPLSFGTAATGGFSTSIFAPAEGVSVPVVGIHFFHGNFGYLFHPLVSESAILIPGGQDEFQARVRSDFGVEIDGLRIA